MEWQGQIYSLDPTDDTYPYFKTECHYGDPVDGFGGYNCGHQIHIYRPEVGRTFTDPLEGTGYTTEEVRKLTTTQRALENEIRKAKREVTTLRAAGLDTTAERAKLRARQQELAELLADNPEVLVSGGSYQTAVNRAQQKLLRVASDKTLEKTTSSNVFPGSVSTPTVKKKSSTITASFTRVHAKTGSMSSQEYLEYKRALEYVKEYKQIILPKAEYAHVMSEINTNMSAEDKKQALVTMSIGDYNYTFINRGFDDYIIVKKTAIDTDAERDF